MRRSKTSRAVMEGELPAVSYVMFVCTQSQTACTRSHVGNDTATTEIYTLSLHDVPISVVAVSLDRKSVVEGKRGDLGGRRNIKKKKNRERVHGGQRQPMGPTGPGESQGLAGA